MLVKQLITILENRNKDHDYTPNRREIYEVTARTLDDITGNNFDGDVARWQKWLKSMGILRMLRSIGNRNQKVNYILENIATYRWKAFS